LSLPYILDYKSIQVCIEMYFLGKIPSKLVCSYFSDEVEEIKEEDEENWHPGS